MTAIVVRVCTISPQARKVWLVSRLLGKKEKEQAEQIAISAIMSGLVCKTNMSECTGTAPATPEPDKDAETDVPAPKPEKKSNIGMILVIFALAGAAGAAYYYIKFVKGRKLKDEDMDFFDDEGYEEEPYINEDDEPQIAEDVETDGD